MWLQESQLNKSVQREPSLMSENERAATSDAAREESSQRECKWEMASHPGLHRGTMPLGRLEDTGHLEWLDQGGNELKYKERVQSHGTLFT